MKLTLSKAQVNVLLDADPESTWLPDDAPVRVVAALVKRGLCTAESPAPGGTYLSDYGAVIRKQLLMLQEFGVLTRKGAK